jgi:acyl transferase domain-containing protein
MTNPYSGLHCWETEIDLHRFPTLKDHAFIQGGAVMPGAAYLEMAFAMAKDTFVDVACLELTDVKLLNLLTLPETQVVNIMCTKWKECLEFKNFSRKIEILQMMYQNWLNFLVVLLGSVLTTTFPKGGQN